MKKLPTLLATVATMALAIALSPSCWAQEGRGSSGRDDQKHRSAHSQTIRGVVAEITTEGEMVFDYRHNRAIEAEAAFLTVVGSPVKSEKGEAQHRATARGEEKHGQSGRRRHDVYIVWLSPRTKVCECIEESGQSKPGQSQASSKGEKKECGLDELEVGDHVEIQFSPREESGGSQIAHQTEKMRGKHGRHRTHVGTATEVTILVSKDDEHPRAGSRDKEQPK
jgi:hypothetical protein